MKKACMLAALILFGIATPAPTMAQTTGVDVHAKVFIIGQFFWIRGTACKTLPLARKILGAHTKRGSKAADALYAFYANIPYGIGDQACFPIDGRARVSKKYETYPVENAGKGRYGTLVHLQFIASGIRLRDVFTHVYNPVIEPIAFGTKI